MFRRIHLLAYFLEVANAGGIRQAADAVHLSQSALTRKIQDLESELKVTLFERTARGMTLTKFGESLKHYAELIDLTCDYALEEINDLLDGDLGELRIGAGPAAAFSLVPDAIAKLRLQLPAVKVIFHGWMNERTLPMLGAGKLDVVFGGLPRPSERDPTLIYEHLIDIDYLVYASERHALYRRRAVMPAQFEAYPWIWFLESVQAHAMLYDYFARSQLEVPKRSVETTSIHFGLQLMSQSEHLALLPSTLRALAKQHGIGVLSTKGPVGSYSAGLIYRESALRLRAFSLFRTLFVEETRKLTKPYARITNQ